MADDAFGKTLAEFQRWANSTDRELSCDLHEVTEELEFAFNLMQDYQKIGAPSQLTASSLSDLLLDVIPRKVVVTDPEELSSTIPALRDLTSYLADTGAVTGDTARAMRSELDRIEPSFAAAVMDPRRWDPATAMARGLHRDGVDIGDIDAINSWLAEQHRGASGGAVGIADDDDPDWEDEPLDWDDDEDLDWDDDLLSWDDIDLSEEFDLPGLVTPVRLPGAAELAELARKAPLLADLRDLARRVRDTTVPTASEDPLLLALAEDCELVEAHGDTLVQGDDVEWLDDLVTDDDALEAWGYAFGVVLDTTLASADETGPDLGEDLDLAGHGIGMIMEMFMSPRAGVPVTQLSQSVKDAATDELPARDAERQWEEWTGAHGDPASLLLGQLARLAAVAVTDGVARLEPLGLHAVVEKLLSCGVEVPNLPPAGEMSADDVVLLRILGDEEDFEADFAVWTAARTPADAARDLLAVAASGGAPVRLTATDLLSRLGDGTEPALRDALGRPELRYYAKTALAARLAGREEGQPVPAELERTAEDVAWFLTDTLAPLSALIERSATFPLDQSKLSDAGWQGSPEELFDAMARLSHPDSEAVLTMLGRHCDDKKTAKAARKAAFKAKSVQASRRAQAAADHRASPAR